MQINDITAVSRKSIQAKTYFQWKGELNPCFLAHGLVIFINFPEILLLLPLTFLGSLDSETFGDELVIFFIFSLRGVSYDYTTLWVELSASFLIDFSFKFTSLNLWFDRCVLWTIS
jgi:hypothetical protein